MFAHVEQENKTVTAIKKYNAFSAELKKNFGCKVQRISVDAGFNCPNRDGRFDTEGCIFCGGHGSGSHGIKRDLDITEQLADGKEVMIRKYRASKFLAYFQAYSNTYAPVEKLRAIFDEALAVPDVIGIIAATRPDCLSEDILDYLAELHHRCYLWLELGLQTMHDESLIRINRHHDHACSIAAIERARSRGLQVCAHLILGLPGESREDIFASVAEMNRLGISGVKLHLLHVMRGTRLAEMYQRGEFQVLERDEYAGLVCDCLERLNPDILIHRLTGDGGHDNLVAPLWSLKKFEILNLIDNELKLRGSSQGSRFKG